MSGPTLSGRRLVITGAGRGLGRALAIVAADQGAEVMLLGRDPGSLTAVAAAIRTRTGRDAAMVPCDLGQPHSIRQACETVLAASPTLDVLINNGAPWLPGDILTNSDDEIAATIAAAVTGTVLLTKNLLPGLIRSTHADIVTIVSTSGLIGLDKGEASSAFHAAKHGQSGFSDALRHELKGHGIRVTAIYPPDFDDADPLDPAWDAPAVRLNNRDIVSAVLYAISSPRHCAHPMIVLDHQPQH